MSTAFTHATEVATKPHVETQRIALREIDLDHLENVDDNPQAVSFRVMLSEMPQEGWTQEFDEIYRQTPYTVKPPVVVSKDTLEITFLPRYASELQGFFQFLGLIVRRANEELQRSEELHASNEQEQRKAQFREALSRIKMPTER